MYKSKELTSLSDAGLENKEKLDISNNLLESLEGIEKSCKTLTWLNVSHNKLKNIQHIKSCTNLNVLNLSYNKLTTASHVSDLKSILKLFIIIEDLKALILNNNELENVEGLGELKVLNTLVVSHNQLSSIDVSNFPNLQKFSASHNQLIDIPDFRKQKDIKDVKLNNNSIKKLPLWLPQCKRIKVLDLGNNKLSSYECIKLLGDLPFLENLNLKGNPLCDTDDYYTKMKTLLPHLKLLDFKNLSGKKLNMSNLSEMYLKELQSKSIVKKTEDENKIKQEIKSNEEPKDRGFVSNITVDKKPEGNPIEVKKKKDKSDLVRKSKKKNKEISSINSATSTSENIVEECKIEEVILDVNTSRNRDSKKRKTDDSKKNFKKKSKGLIETEIKKKKKKVKSDRTKVAKKEKSGIISVKKIKTVNDNKDISILLKNISNGDNLGSGLASTW